MILINYIKRSLQTFFLISTLLLFFLYILRFIDALIFLMKQS